MWLMELWMEGSHTTVPTAHASIHSPSVLTEASDDFGHHVSWNTLESGKLVLGMRAPHWARVTERGGNGLKLH